MSTVGWGRQKVWRTSTHPVRSRTQSRGLVTCRSIFRRGGSISPAQNPAYVRSRPTFCIPETAGCGWQIAVSASDLAASRRLAASIERTAATVSRWLTFCAPTRYLTTHGPGPWGTRLRIPSSIGNGNCPALRLASLSLSRKLSEIWPVEGVMSGAGYRASSQSRQR